MTTCRCIKSDSEARLAKIYVREAAHGGNGLLRDVVLRGRIALVVALADTVDLLVEFRTVVVTVCIESSASRAEYTRSTNVL